MAIACSQDSMAYLNWKRQSFKNRNDHLTFSNDIKFLIAINGHFSVFPRGNTILK
jgi:hypothetical protein